MYRFEGTPIAVASGGNVSGDSAISVDTSTQPIQVGFFENIPTPAPKVITLYDRLQDTGNRLKLKMDKFLEEFRYQHVEC